MIKSPRPALEDPRPTAAEALAPEETTEPQQTQVAHGYYGANGTFVTRSRALQSPRYQSMLIASPGPPAQGDKDRVRAQIDEFASHTPRFLFRAWNEYSGGGKGLNTPDAITPLAFAKGIGPASIHDLPTDILAGLASMHCAGDVINSIFSSWSGSLSFVLTLALGMPRESAHISVVDTAELMSGSKGTKTMLWTPKLNHISPSCQGGPLEFLAFGVISGKAHQAVRLTELAETGLDTLWSADWNVLPLRTMNELEAADDVREKEDSLQHVALRVGKLFGKEFHLPMTANFFTLLPKSKRGLSRLVEGLWADTPEQWRDDPNIMEPGHDNTGGLRDTENATAVLRSLVHRRYGGGPAQAPASPETKSAKTAAVAQQAAAPGDTDDDAAMRSAKDQGSSSHGVAKSKRVPKMVRELYSNMVGCKDTNAMLSK
ncbi:hypothetical protein LTR85_005190 [Meristemomyces frigidus]|nr:hypothetical protein LTR85_005190 [Meristemomyces frigidus]